MTAPETAVAGAGAPAPSFNQTEDEKREWKDVGVDLDAANEKQAEIQAEHGVSVVMPTASKMSEQQIADIVGHNKEKQQEYDRLNEMSDQMNPGKLTGEETAELLPVASAEGRDDSEVLRQRYGGGGSARTFHIKNPLAG